MFKLMTFYFLYFLLIQDHLHADPKTKCEYETVSGYSYADCSEMRLTEFPKDIKQNIEGLFLTWNFIEVLHNDTFLNFSSIKFLYLDRNPGLIIESYAFAPLTKLNVLDISHNRIVNISNIHLPTSLKKLYLSGVTTISSSIELPISSLRELNYLDLSRCELNQIPSFGGNLPSLEALNLTTNTLANFKVDNLAFLCQLKKLYISHDLPVRNKCECLKIEKWLQDQRITGSFFSCNNSISVGDCNATLSASFLKTYESCKSDVMTKKFFYWLLIGCGVFGVCFSCIVLYICCHRKGLFCDVICCRCCKNR